MPSTTVNGCIFMLIGAGNVQISSNQTAQQLETAKKNSGS
jgi:hypothetical protein